MTAASLSRLPGCPGHPRCAHAAQAAPISTASTPGTSRKKASSFWATGQACHNECACCAATAPRYRRSPWPRLLAHARQPAQFTPTRAVPSSSRVVMPSWFQNKATFFGPRSGTCSSHQAGWHFGFQLFQETELTRRSSSSIFSEMALPTRGSRSACPPASTRWLTRQVLRLSPLYGSENFIDHLALISSRRRFSEDIANWCCIGCHTRSYHAWFMKN